MHHTRIFHEAGFIQLIFPFLFISFDHRDFVRRLTEWELILPTFNLVGNCEVIAKVFRYRPAEVISSLGHDSVCLLIVDFFTYVLADELGIRLRRRSRFCQMAAVIRNEMSSSEALCNTYSK